MELIVSGHTNPSTAKIAMQTGAGRRSIFPHFEDIDAIHREMDTIHREIDVIPAEAYQPVVEAPFQSDAIQPCPCISPPVLRPNTPQLSRGSLCLSLSIGSIRCEF